MLLLAILFTRIIHIYNCYYFVILVEDGRMTS